MCGAGPSALTRARAHLQATGKKGGSGGCSMSGGCDNHPNKLRAPVQSAVPQQPGTIAVGVPVAPMAGGDAVAKAGR